MAQAAYCSQCGTNVYVTPDGRCPQGHGPEFLSDYYETDEGAGAAAPVQEPAYTPPAYTPAPTMGAGAPVQPAQKKSKVGLIIGIVLAVLVLCGVGTGVAMCTVFKGAEDAINTAIEDVDINTNTTTDPNTTTSPGTQGPDTTPALQPGVTRVVLGWDESADLDLEIWTADEQTLVTRALTVNDVDITDGTQGREYFDFNGEYATGEYVVSVYFVTSNAGPDSTNATVTVYKADGTTETRTVNIMYDPGSDQWHAFSIDAATGDIVDIGRFIDISTTE